MQRDRRAKVYDIPVAPVYQRRSDDTPAVLSPGSHLQQLHDGWRAIRNEPKYWYGIEGLLTFALLAVGVVVWLPFDTFGVSRTYAVLTTLSPSEAVWGALFTLPTLYHLDRWLVRDPDRTRSFSVVIGLWLFLMVLQLASLSPSSIWLLYPVYLYSLTKAFRHLMRAWRGAP